MVIENNMLKNSFDLLIMGFKKAHEANWTS